jgi:hypothetical protein
MNIRARLRRLEQDRPPDDGPPRCRCPFSMDKVKAEIDRGFREGGVTPDCADCGRPVPYPIAWTKYGPEGMPHSQPATP